MWTDVPFLSGEVGRGKPIATSFPSRENPKDLSEDVQSWHCSSLFWACSILLWCQLPTCKAEMERPSAWRHKWPGFWHPSTKTMMIIMRWASKRRPKGRNNLHWPCWWWVNYVLLSFQPTLDNHIRTLAQVDRSVKILLREFCWNVVGVPPTWWMELRAFGKDSSKCWQAIRCDAIRDWLEWVRSILKFVPQ